MAKEQKEKTSEVKTKEKKVSKRRQTFQKNTVKESAAVDTAHNDATPVKDTFLGIKKRNFLFAFISLTSFMFLLILINSLRSTHFTIVAFLILALLYTFPVWFAILKKEFTFSKINFKSILYTLRNWLVWTAGFIFISIFTFAVTRLLYVGLYLFYEKFPGFCGTRTTLSSIVRLQYHNFVAVILILSSVSLFVYLRKRFKKYDIQGKKLSAVILIKTLEFAKNIFCFLFSVAVSFVILLSLQYTIKGISGIALCTTYQYVESHDCEGNQLMKPIIYLYPTETTDVSVKLGAVEKLTHTYPKYVDEWKVRAEPDGNLTDMVSGRKYYALYWEGKNANLSQYDDGFVVAKDEVVPFLEEKLARLGLNEREANEFIIYWLPKLESAPYTFVHFGAQEEQNKSMPLDIQPKPDTIIRVLMAFKSLDKPINVKEQVLPETPVRNGFTVIEWGGTDLSSGVVK